MTERNEPCTCGSGKKYKKCCMKDATKGPKRLSIAPIAMPAQPQLSAQRKMRSVEPFAARLSTALAMEQIRRHRGIPE